MTINRISQSLGNLISFIKKRWWLYAPLVFVWWLISDRLAGYANDKLDYYAGLPLSAIEEGIILCLLLLQPIAENPLRSAIAFFLFLSLIVFCQFVTVRIVESRRWR